MKWNGGGKLRPPNSLSAQGRPGRSSLRIGAGGERLIAPRLWVPLTAQGALTSQASASHYSGSRLLGFGQDETPLAYPLAHDAFHS